MQPIGDSVRSQSSKRAAKTISDRLVQLRPTALGLDTDSDGDSSTRAPSSGNEGIQSKCTTPFQIAPLLLPRHLPTSPYLAVSAVRKLSFEHPPGLSSPSARASKGSALHHIGKCKPCAWFHKPNGCENGRDCSHCHLCPEGEIHARKKAKRQAKRASRVEKREAGVDEGLAKTNETATTCGTCGMLALEEDDQERNFQEAHSCALSAHSTHGEHLSALLGLTSHSVAPETATPQPPISLASAVEQTSCTSASVGSINHGSGICRPCAFIHRTEGCQNGYDCSFCHACPVDAIKERKKAKRNARRARGLQLDSEEQVHAAYHEARVFAGSQDLDFAATREFATSAPVVRMPPLATASPSHCLQPLFESATNNLARETIVFVRPPPGLASPLPTERSEFCLAPDSDQSLAVHGSGSDSTHCKTVLFLDRCIPSTDGPLIDAEAACFQTTFPPAKSRFLFKSSSLRPHPAFVDISTMVP